MNVQVESIEGECDWPEVGEDFQMNEEAPGGLQGATGSIAAERVLRKPHIYRQGSILRVFHPQVGCVYGGELLDPAIAGGIATLSVRGWSFRAERFVQHLVFQARAPRLLRSGSFTGISGTLVHHDAMGSNSLPPGAVVIELNPSISSADTVLHIRVPGQTFRRLAFRAAAWADPFHIGVIPGIQEDTFGSDAAFSVDVPSPTPVDFQVDLSVEKSDDSGHQGTTPNPNWPSDGVTIEVFAMESATTAWLWDVRVNGEVAFARGDEWTVSDLVHDLAARCRVADFAVQAHPLNVLPYELKDVAASDGFDHADLLTGWRHLFLDTGTQPYVDWGPPDSRVFFVLDEQQPFAPTPQERFDRVIISVPQANEQSIDQPVVLPNSPLERHNTYDRVDLADADFQISESQDVAVVMAKAQAFAYRLLDHLVVQRWGGDFSLARVFDPDSGRTVTAHVLHAGDTLFHPASGASGMIASLTRPIAGPVTGSLEENYAPLDRMVARRKLRLKQQHMH